MISTQNHPIFTHTNEIANICSPLQDLDINYFSHVVISQQKNFSVLSNNPRFMEIYFKKKYFNVDIHTGKLNHFGKYVIWDDVPRSGKTLEMAEDAASLDIKHTFTIIQQLTSGTHFYHFSSPHESSAINQSYFANLELLTLFINHFKEAISASPELARAYQTKFQVDDHAEGYTLKKDSRISIDDQHTKFLSRLRIPQLSVRERECLRLTLQGKSAKEIAHILSISFRTVETHLENVKAKSNANSKSQLIEKWLELYQL